MMKESNKQTILARTTRMLSGARRAAMMLLLCVLTTVSARADYGWYSGSMNIGGINTDPTAWSTSGDSPTDLGYVLDMTITSIAFNVWDDSNDRGGANMYFRIWDGGDSPVGSDQDIWLGDATRITGDHDFAISYSGSYDLADEVRLNLESGKTYYIDMWAKTYGDAGDHWYSDNGKNYHAKLTIIDSEDFSVSGNNYTIKTADGWSMFCRLLNNGMSFSGKTVLLNNNIEVNTMAGNSSYPFDGTFNGQGHKLTVSYDISNQTYVAPFSYVSGATFKNLMVDGSIAASTNSAAGLIGDAGSGTSITNCLVSATLSGNATYSYYVTGTAPTFTNSYYTSTVGNAQGNLAHSITADEQANMTLTGYVGVQYGSTAYAASGETVSLTLANPNYAPTGYTSLGSYSASSGTLNGSATSYTLTMPNGDVTITSLTPTIYNITYHAGEGATFSTTKTSYTIESPDITLDTPTKEHYDFAGWYINSGLTGDPVTTITTGSTGPKEFWAKWTPTEYSITYNDVPNGYTIVFDDSQAYSGSGEWVYSVECIIDGNTYEMPREYNSHTQNMEYTFTYWGTPTSIKFKTTMSGEVPSIYESEASAFNANGGNITMTKESESKSFTGSYTVTVLSINPATYTIESPDITLNKPTKLNYYFAGWKGTGLSAPTRDVTITSGSTGNREYTATWANIIDISNSTNCTATVPDQMLDNYSYISYKFGAANEGNATIGEVVKYGDTILELGTDYEFGNVYFYETTNPSTDEENKLGDHFTVEIKGKGAYTGTIEADFYIGVYVKPTVWEDVTWTISNGGELSIYPTNAKGGKKPMPTAANRESYPWYPYASYITSISISENIETVSSNAFASTSNVSTYGNVTTVSLPSTLTSIGDNAFAFCTGATINLDKLPSGVTIGTNAFYLVGKMVGTLKESSDNTALIELMSEASKANITLSGRTLKKNGSWNSLCLPFSINDIDAQEEGVYTCPLHEATILELDNSAQGTTFDNSNHKLTLTFKAATSIEAGKPYLVKWASGTDISNPTFTNVKIDKETPILVTSNGGTVTFKGSYSPYTNNGEVLLKESTAATATNAFHAFVKVNDQLTYAVEGVYSNAQFTGDQVTTLTLDVNNQMVCYVKTGTLTPVSTNYIDADGTAQTVDALVLDPSWTSLPEGTYVVNSDINFSNALTLGGDVTLILADGKNMQMGSSAQPMAFNGIVCDVDRNHNLTIYGQSGQTGRMKVYVQKDNGFAIAAKDIAIYGGNVTVSNVGSGHGISSNSMTVKTGTVEAFGGIDAIVSNGDFSVTDCQMLTASAAQDYAVKSGAVTISNGTVSLNGLKGLDCSSLNISGSTVNVECTNPSTSGILSCVNVSGDATISGSQLSVNATQGANYYVGLDASSVTINGGQTTVTSESTTTNDYYRRIDAPVTFSYTNASDFIMADSYGSLTIANSQTVSDGTAVYSGTLESTQQNNQINAVRGKTLRPFTTLSLADNADNTDDINGWNGGMATVTLAGRTLYKDGKWNTLCLPFDVKDSDYESGTANENPGGRDRKPLTDSPLAGCTLKELDTEGIYSGHKTGLEDDGTLYLNFKDAYEIEAGKPYLIKWASGENLESPVFNYAIIDKNNNFDTSADGYVTFTGTYAANTLTDEDKSILFLSVNNNKNTLYYPKSGAKINAFRAYFQLNNGLTAGDANSQVRAFNLSFGDEGEKTGIATTNFTNFTNSSDAWYDLSGRKLSGKPTKKGLYINNGRKVVIK